MPSPPPQLGWFKREDFEGLFVGVSSKKIGIITPKWRVKIMENPIKMDDLGVKPPFLETPM